MSMVRSEQRFRSRGPLCPICDGGSDLPPHHGIRCYGFEHDDPRFVTCTRIESGHADANGDGWTHFIGPWLPCDCGQEHGAGAQRPLAVHRTDTASTSDRGEYAREIWRDTVAAEGTLVEVYLRSRGIVIEPPASLRFGRIWHSPTEQERPAMVAAVTDTSGERLVAVHRTYLREDGCGKANIDAAKMMLGPTKGLAVHLAPLGPRVAVAEGIETALSVLQATGAPTLAALSAGGVERLELPPLPLAAEVVIAADADKRGSQAAVNAAIRWKDEGRAVRIATPPTGDFNDVLRGVS